MDFTSNITPSIQAKLGRNLHLQKYHPIEIIKNKIYNYFGSSYEKFDDLLPIVSIEDNFDKLLIPSNHPARSKSDTYYVDQNTVLRTHTSAHQNHLLCKGYTKFLVTGDVYRKDEVDCHHYPVFHQMEGVCVLDSDNAESEVKLVLSGLVEYLFPGCKYRINDDYFPFTHPSYEFEVEFNGKWLEILGCGVVQPTILQNCGLEQKHAWAFGLGLERLAMILFDIPDIRYFWTTDDAFLKQFASNDIVKFKPYPKLPPLTKDISFWIPSETDIQENKWLHENDFFEICREIGTDMIEEVELFDTFHHPKKKQYSRSYHIVYSCPDTSLKNPGEFNTMVNEMHQKIASAVGPKLAVVLR
ncbi:phenylalanyl-tRNA synthetase [Tupanvirus soda lake]|uniref:Phenylalanyl-tRNA synthetase n=1 Tax=Tupanvirus deep ocean TaxID=2126984 RepID=A0AC59HC01_9VIRU|nr:phenylalanyl-tRNA synthetase [Tupanvirus soda lake]AUL77644.2 phenylalanyl-tRNA synthetase [Tupanvirus soda lake]